MDVLWEDWIHMVKQVLLVNERETAADRICEFIAAALSALAAEQQEGFLENTLLFRCKLFELNSGHAGHLILL